MIVWFLSVFAGASRSGILRSFCVPALHLNERGPMNYLIGLVPIYARGDPTDQPMLVNRSPHTSRGIRLSGTGIGCALLEEVGQIYATNLANSQRRRCLGTKALTMRVRAHNGYRLCDQELIHRKILIWIFSLRRRGENPYSLLRILGWAKRDNPSPGLRLPTHVQNGWQRQRVRVTQTKTRG